MRVGIYPGSFNPWHEGHTDILKKALKTYDKIIVAIGVNPHKDIRFGEIKGLEKKLSEVLKSDEFAKIEVKSFDNSLANFVASYFTTDANGRVTMASAVIRGLRNIQDFESEKTQQYWCEDMGLKVPIAYFICDRKLSHISSSAIRMVSKIKS